MEKSKIANLIDTHAHLASKDYPDVNNVITRAREAGVAKIICVASATEEIPKAIALAEKFSGVYLSLGIHPQDTKNTSPFQLDLKLKKLEVASLHPKVVAIGECGFDNSVPSAGERKRDVKEQEYIFEFQTHLAQKLNKPQVLHCRQAKDKMVEALKEYSVTNGVWHCFVEDALTAKLALKLGLLLSFNGIVTYKSGGEILKIARTISLDKILLETDSPLLIPEPARSDPKIKLNEPSYVKIVAQKIAGARNISEKDLATATSQNAQLLFGLNYD